MQMNKRNVAWLIVAGALGLAGKPAWAGLEIKKNWYASRAKSNMEIKNYKAAIEAYEKLLEEDPDNSEARKSLATAYEAQGLKDKAVEQYDRYLEKHPEDSRIAFKQADTLGWSRYSYRRKDALKYYRMGLKQEDDPKMRLRYAKLLASNKEDSSEAIEQYRMVLKSQPRNGEAHRGLAQAYAWNGERDQAVYHAEMAQRSGYRASDLHRLERDLNRGHEPQAGAELEFIAQPGGRYELNGMRMIASGRRDLSPFVTGRVRAGYENYWQGAGDSAAGGMLSLGAEVRLDETSAVEGELGYHGISPVTSATSRTASASSVQGVTGKVEYRVKRESLGLAAGFERELKTDSFLALAGSRLFGTGLGAARSNTVYANVKWGDEPWAFSVKPYAGWVSALTVDSNSVIGADVELSHRMTASRELQLSLVELMQLSHYGTDQSALTGTGAGYFSPKAFMSHYPHLVAKMDFNDRQQLEAEGGLLVQYVNDQALDGAWQLGGSVGLGFNTTLGDRFQWKMGGSYTLVADRYNRLGLNSGLSYTF